MTTPTTNRQLFLASRPKGAIEEGTFQLREAPLPALQGGQFLVRNIYVSIDPTMRGWLIDRPSYVPPIQVGETMRAFGCGEVVESRNDAFLPGDRIQGVTGWQDYAIADSRSPMLAKVPGGMSLQHRLSVFGLTGLTAYFGMLDIGQPKSGETVVVSGAAGATGSVAGQIAKIKGCRVIGTAGTDEKCRWVKDDLGFDECINYRTEDLDARLRETCPGGIDVYFDNVGRDTLDSVLLQIGFGARIVLCGGISSGYNELAEPWGPKNYFQLIVTRSRMEGFLVTHYAPRFDEATAEMRRWMAEGSLASREQVVEGLENCPKALQMLFDGENTGKLLVQIGAE